MGLQQSKDKQEEEYLRYIKLHSNYLDSFIERDAALIQKTHFNKQEYRLLKQVFLESNTSQSLGLSRQEVGALFFKEQVYHGALKK